MKFLSLLSFTLAALVIYSCNQKKIPAAEEKKKDFLPVIDFLAGEIKHIDTVPYSFTNYITIDDKTDTVYISKVVFHNILQEFLEVNICDKKYVDFYDETSLIDTSTRLASFTYLSNSPDMKVSRIDAYIEPTSGKFRKIFIKRIYNNADTLVEKQLFWQTTGNFILTTIKTVNAKETIKQERVVWDEKEE